MNPEDGLTITAYTAGMTAAEGRAGATTISGYGHDTAGCRLTSVSQNGSVIATYGYDPNGNRTQQGGVTIATVDAKTGC